MIRPLTWKCSTKARGQALELLLLDLVTYFFKNVVREADLGEICFIDFRL